jgi:hypothetical protein
MQGRRGVVGGLVNGSSAALRNVALTGRGGQRRVVVNGTPTNSNTNNNKNNAPTGADFYPKLITSQIIALQCFHYFLLAFLFQVNHVLYNTSITIDRIFTDRYIHLWNSQGWPDVCAIFIGSLVG